VKISADKQSTVAEPKIEFHDIFEVVNV